MNRAGLIFAIAMLASIASGCGSGVKCVPASGTVKLDGEPLSDVQVTTQPVEISGNAEDHPGSRAHD